MEMAPIQKLKDMRLAILDFGTNTFNLLIAENKNGSGVEFLHSSKEPVKLGKGGINNRLIKEEAIERGLRAIENHYRTIRQYEADKVYAFATSAIRDAKNNKEFVRRVKDNFELYVNIIPGEREAELIYKGVRHACNFDEEKILIIDIGGGSVEFIIADKNKIHWMESLNIGMARALDQFQPEDPISVETVKKVEEFFSEKLSPLFEAIRKYKPSSMVGASGSYETFFELIKHRLPEKYRYITDDPGKEIYLEDYRGIHELLLKSTLEERKKMPGMEPVRIEMIVLASIFVNFILKNWKFNKMMLSEYALKEGVIAEILNI
jgi:exopolyphosphatase/guanosine-5'-triphosphate,3'-diphosphate pyrophosphatase